MQEENKWKAHRLKKKAGIMDDPSHLTELHKLRA